MSETNSKKFEVEYPHKLDDDGRAWLLSKPFGRPPEFAQSPALHLIDFGHILQLLELPRSARVLDVAAGPGWTSVFLSKTGYRVTGIDIAPEMLRIARERAKIERALTHFVLTDMELLPFQEAFDGALIYDALHHAQDPLQVARACCASLKPGGTILIAEPNFKHRFFEGRRASQIYGTKERGLFPFQYKRILRKAGFVRVQRFHNNKKMLFGNSLSDAFKHLAEPFVYRFILSQFWTQIWLRARKGPVPRGELEGNS